MAHGRFVPPIVLAILVGLGEHLYFGWTDRRQFPTVPHGRIIYFFLGFLAATLGALAVPAILTADYTAGVFLAIGGQQFHSVRAEERKLLKSLDEQAVVPRGNAYVEGMAMAMEARNYLVLLTATLVALATLKAGWAVGLAVGAGAAALFQRLGRGESLGDVAELRLEEAEDGAARVLVYRAREDARSRAILKNPGERQAILHDLAVSLGMRLDPSGRPLAPTAEMTEEGLRVLIHPETLDPQKILGAARRVPVLESVASPLR